MLNVEQLQRLHDAGEVDTVLVVFPDHQGRFMGKRVQSGFFLSELSHNGGMVEACNYLLAVDVDMKVLQGFQSANWESGFGDFQCRPDLSTLRLTPWLERTALVICDLYEQDGTPTTVAPRTILKRQTDAAAAHGFTIKAAPSSSSSCSATP